MIHIRHCSENDMVELAQLFTLAFGEPPYRERWTVEAAAAYLTKFLEMDPGSCFIATGGSEIVGAIFGYTYPWRSGVNYFIQELFVHERRRREGIGRQLVRHVVRQHGKSAAVSLIANERSQAARFYESLGLQQHKTYKFYCGMVRT